MNTSQISQQARETVHDILSYAKNIPLLTLNEQLAWGTIMIGLIMTTIAIVLL
jgi:hypothetical protein